MERFLTTPGFSITVEKLRAGTIRVAPHGALDLAHAYRFDDAMRRAEREGPDAVILDLRELQFLDSSGLARIVAARRRSRRVGRRLVVVRGPQQIRRLFALAALEEHFEFVSELPELAPA